MTLPHFQLEWIDEGSNEIRRARLASLPFRIGRSGDVHLALDDDGVSKAHAELFDDGKGLRIRDLGSRNGTFVNRRRVAADAPVRAGDTLHFGRFEVRLVTAEDEEDAGMTRTTAIDPGALSALLSDTNELERLLAERAVEPYFQAIVPLADPGRPVAFEVLGRGALAGFAQSPGELFRIAHRIRREEDLSRLFRDRGIEVGMGLPGAPHLFVNTHPAELKEDGLVRGLESLRMRSGAIKVTLEIHERAVTDPERMKRLRADLRRLDIGLAYDDFGAGEARLAELADVPPDVLKFDVALVRDLDKAPPQRVEIVQTLVRMARHLGVATLAEGVETEAEADACRTLGFELGQGYLFGRPAPASAL